MSRYYEALAGCLQALAQGNWGLEPGSFPLHRLRNLAMTLPPGSGVDQGEPSGSSSPSHGLTLTTAGQGLLDLCLLPSMDNQVGGELAQELSETLRDLAISLGAALRRQQVHRIRGLYVIIDPQLSAGRDPLELGAAAIRGGAGVLQLRDKRQDKQPTMDLAISLQQLCQAHQVLLIINDHADLAAVIGADGLHVGQGDLPVAEARQVLRQHQLLGRSNHEIEELVISQDMGADHVAFGPIYTTGTKVVEHSPQGIQALRRARSAARVPLVAIGGINADNVGPVVAAGADAICVTAAVLAAPDPEAAASRLVTAIKTAGGKP